MFHRVVISFLWFSWVHWLVNKHRLTQDSEDEVLFPSKSFKCSFLSVPFFVYLVSPLSRSCDLDPTNTMASTSATTKVQKSKRYFCLKPSNMTQFGAWDNRFLSLFGGPNGLVFVDTWWILGWIQWTSSKYRMLCWPSHLTSKLREITNEMTY